MRQGRGTVTIPAARQALKLTCEAGTYEAPTLMGILWLVIKHRTWHLLQGHGWVD